MGFFSDFTLGGVSGAVAKTITTPVELVRVVIETQDGDRKIRSGVAPRYKGMGECCKLIYKEHGITSFWNGHTTVCIRYLPTQALNLSLKDAFKQMFPTYDPKTSFGYVFGVNVLSGGLAAASTSCFVFPLDSTISRMAADVSSQKTTRLADLGNFMYKTATGPGGVRQFYRGFTSSAGSIVAYRGVQLGVFDTITGINPWKDRIIGGVISTFAAAQAATIIGAGVAYPLSTVRRRLKMQSNLPVEERAYKGATDCLRKIAAEEGITKGLYKGFLANIVRSVGGALVLLFYDRAKTYSGV